MRRYLSFVLVLSFVSALAMQSTLEQTSPAYACIGDRRPPNISELLEKNDIVVQAEIVEVDDLQRNAIAKITAYVVGDIGSEYIAIKQSIHFRDSANYWGIGSTSNACYTQGYALTPGDSGLLFLRKDMDGAYYYWMTTSMHLLSIVAPKKWTTS